MRSCGTSGITTRFQELFRCMGQVGHALLTRSPLSPRQQAARDPVRLACVKHAASVHPEPESNPPQKTFMESQQTALKKKKDGPSNKEGRSHKNPDTHQTPSGTTRAGIGLAIKNHKPHPHGCDPWQVVQYTLLSSQTTKHTHNPDPEEPDQTASGSKRKTYTTTPTNTTHRRVATHKTQQPQCFHRRVTQHNYNPQPRPTYFFPTTVSSVVSLYIGRP